MSVPHEERGNARAAVVNPTLALARGRVAGGRALCRCKTAVVRGEKNEGVVHKSLGFKMIDESADIVVEIVDHRRIYGIRMELSSANSALAVVQSGEVVAELEGIELVESHPSCLFLKIRHLLGLAVEGVVDVVVPEVEVKGLVRAIADKVDRLVRQSVGQMLALGTVGQSGDTAGHYVAVSRSAPMTAADIDFKADLVGIVCLITEMPFADVPGVVAAVTEKLRDRGFLKRNMVDLGRVDQLAVARMNARIGDPVGDAYACRVFTRQK